MVILYNTHIKITFHFYIHVYNFTCIFTSSRNFKVCMDKKEPRHFKSSRPLLGELRYFADPAVCHNNNQMNADSSHCLHLNECNRLIALYFASPLC